MENKIEIMSPVGSYESLEAAIKAKTDSVYFGVEQLNMRARASNNFSLKDLKEIVKRCKDANIKTYLTVNTIIYDHDLNLMKKICNLAKRAGVNAILACDMSVISYANSIELKVHISTQANVSNIEAVKFYSKFSDAVVLARELTLNQIKNICKEIEKQDIKGPSGELIKVEIFAHGALCVAIAGKCYMSLATENSSANRGVCLQNCRKSYRVIDEETGQELTIENKYIMSPKDLCIIGFLDKILDSGISILKIEGRGRPADYVYTVTKIYKEAVDSVIKGTYNKEKIKRWIKELETVYNRGFWHGGYYLGKKLEEWSGVYGSKSTKEKVMVGVCKHYFPRTNIGEFFLHSGKIELGDEILIIGKTTGILKQKVDSLYINEKPVSSAKNKDIITIKVNERVRENDKLFVLIERKNYQGLKPQTSMQANNKR